MKQQNVLLSAIPKKMWILLGIAFVIRLLIFFRFQPWNPLVIEKQILIFDSLQYHSLALSIRDHFSFANDAFRTPGYPAFLPLYIPFLGLILLQEFF